MILNFDTSNDEDNLGIHLSNIAKAPDWILDLAPRPESLDDDTYQRGTCVAVTAHNALLKVTIERHGADGASEYKCATQYHARRISDSLTAILVQVPSPSPSQN
jgi:hypothetical protein